ncbi:MAG: hypothetical protein GEV11_27285 [Streptosporangiales bacterium]|nr:hypothetical protein [Streptosporangiales bacterium]
MRRTTDISAGEIDPSRGDEGAAIEGDFPGWGVWRSDTGRWWAYRTQADPLTIGQMRAGCRLIVQAETPAGLRTAIRTEQAAAEAAQD